MLLQIYMIFPSLKQDILFLKNSSRQLIMNEVKLTITLETLAVSIFLGKYSQIYQTIY